MTARAKRATRRSQRHAEEPVTTTTTTPASNSNVEQEISDQVQLRKDGDVVNREDQPEASSSTSTSPSRPVKRELIDEAEEQLRVDLNNARPTTITTSRKERAASAGDAYFKKRRTAL